MPSRRIPAAARTTKRRQTVAVRPAHPPVEPEEKDRPDDCSHRMLIVGIGASAGGLEAFTQLLARLPLDTGMAFVLVQHLDPDHESALTQILSRATQMPVGEVTHNQPPQANHVYIIPRDTKLSIVEGLLKLEPRERTRMPHRPIDTFFESLAQDQRERAIGVVLSGTASDGALGLEAIKADGGFTFAQDDSAKYDSMPRSAVAAGCVDLVLAPADIAKELTRIAKHPFATARPLELPTRAEKDHENAIAHQDDDQPLPSGGRGTPLTGGRQARDEADQGEKDPSNGYKKILLLLRNHSGVDFSLYRSSTIQRRIARRIVLARQDTLKGYESFLRDNAGELDSLFSDVLISVTSFFRNPEAFDVLQRHVLPKLLAQRGDDPVRCWVLGCSTGQEAYSLAISFVEAARKAPRARKVQIFATDLNEKLLEKARHGLYAKTLAQDISPERLRQFFVEENGGYRISKSLRDMVVFGRQNLIADPPFSRMDLISCRNLLIYLDPSLQQKVMPAFHYALKPHGYLLLGASESVSGFTNLFEPVDRKHKIFSKKPAPTPGFLMPVRRAEAKRAARGPLLPLPIGQASLSGGLKLSESFRGELNAQREADRIAVTQFAPPGVLINEALQVLQFRGPTGAYLEPPAGKASFDVLKMAREGLMLPLRAAINKAKQGNKTVRAERVRVTRDGVTETIHVAVIPLKNLRERCFLVVFEEAGETGRATGLARARRQPAATPLSVQQELRRIAELEADLFETREYLHTVQEQHEAANEELQASNEEVQSANEELRSINEELETSKEELESANEELTTVNEEMLNRNVELHCLNSDLLNFQHSAKLAVVLLRRDLTVRRFSPQAEKQLGLLAADIGRPIGHIRHTFVLTEGAGVPLDLEALSAKVIADVREEEHEVRDISGYWYALYVRPYMTLDNKVDGAVLVLLDIDARKRAQLASSAAQRLAENTLETVREPLLVLDHQFRIDSANRAFYRCFGIEPVEVIGRSIYEVNNRQWDIPALRLLFDDILLQRSTVEDFLVEHEFEHVGFRSMLLNARRIENPQSKAERILLAFEDVTEQKEMDVLKARLSAIVESSDDAVLSKDLLGIVTSWNKGAQRLFGYTDQDMIGRHDSALVPLECQAEESRILEQVKAGEDTDHHKTVRLRKDGSRIQVSLTVSPIKDIQGQVIGLSEIAHDITARELLEAVLRQNEALFTAILKQAPVGMYIVDAQFRMQQVNARALPMFSSVHPLIGRDFTEVVTILWGQEVGGQVADTFRHILETGERYISSGFSNRRHDIGVEQSYHWEAWRVTLPGGQWGVVCYFTDITERKRAEGELERRVVDRTQELMQLHIQLRALTTELNLTEQRERRRLATELHDHLAQLLVVGKMKLGQSKRLTLSTEKRNELIEETDTVLSDALAYTRTLVIDLSPPILREFGLPAAIRWLGERMQQHGLTVTVHIEDEDLLLPEDQAVLLFQSIRELLMNTIKHAKSDSATIQLERQFDTLRIKVRDEGVGFDLAATPASASTKFGLFSIRERMRALGGHFDLQSALGEGTTATLVLPLDGTRVPGSALGVLSAELSGQAVGPRSENPTLTTLNLPLDGQGTKRIRVLLVDDHAMVRQGLRTVLDSYPDLDVVGEAWNGKEAVASAERLQPSIIVMDINMPMMNGIDATTEIVTRYPDIVVIGLSVQAGGANEEAMKQAGAAMLLTKEAAVDELYQAILQALKEKALG